MIIELGQIARIQTGLFAKPGSKGDIVYLQAKHFDENGELMSTLYPDLKWENNVEKHLLKPGDVLFAAKGSKNFATWYELKNKPAVASTSFFVIRIQENYRDKIIPEFLVWLINHPHTQKLLKGKAIGTSIASISKTVLEDLKISLPVIETQKIILKIHSLRLRSKKIQKQLENLNEQYIQYLLIKSIQL